MSNSSNTVVGLLAGTVIGATLGILFAPEKGEITRQRISEEALAAKEKISEQAIQLKDKANSTYAEKKETFGAQLEDAMSNVSFKAEDIISTIEQKLSDLKDKNRNLQKNSIEDLKENFNKTV